MESATILTNLTWIPSGPVDVSDLNNFSTRRTSPWDTSRSLKLAGLSSGRDSISSSRQKGKSLLTGKVLSAVQAKNEFNLSGSCRKGCWLGFNLRWIIRHTSFGLLEDNGCLVKVSSPTSSCLQLVSDVPKKFPGLLRASLVGFLPEFIP